MVGRSSLGLPANQPASRQLASQKAVVDAKRRPRKSSNMQKVEMCREAPPFHYHLLSQLPVNRKRKNGEKMIYVDAMEERSGRQRKANNNREK